MKKFLILVLFIFAGSISAQWYNLQWPPTATINEGEAVDVYAHVWIDGVTNVGSPGVGISAWIGVHNENTDPSTWPEDAWIAASFNGDVGNNDEFTAAIGGSLSGGTYYYASRFLYEPPGAISKNNETQDIAYWYGGTGGPWNNDSGVLTVNAVPTIGWANLQWPPTATIQEGNSVDVYAQVWMDGVTNVGSPGNGILAWIGINDENTNPATWSDSAWQVANFNTDVGNNDEFTAAIGSNLTEGTYYYVSRFAYQPPVTLKDDVNRATNGLNYYYGGYNGGAWDSTNNVAGVLTVNALPDTVIDWANLQWPPSVDLVDQLSFTAYGQVYEAGITSDSGKAPEIEAWFGLNTENTDPATWPEASWKPGTYNVDVGNNDEYMAQINLLEFAASIGNLQDPPEEFYYSVRYRLNGGEYFYGGFQGGFWDGVNNVNGEGTLDFTGPASLGWCNLQWPPSIDLNQGESETVYAQMWIDGVTQQEGPTANVPVFIGVHNENTDPSTWPDEAWIPAEFNTDVGNNDEFMADIGAGLEPGTYYYASRFIPGGIKSFYGGYNAEGGGFWNGNTNVSGVLTISSDLGPMVDWCNLQWPPTGDIQEGDEYMVYAQAWIDGITNAEGVTPGLTAWIGISNEDTSPEDWDESAWYEAGFNVDAGNNDEFWLDIGPYLSGGTYYYATRFQYENGVYSYGGYNEGGGGFWDGTTNVSGVVTVDPSTSVEDEAVPTVYAMDQNYPNPFNPSTTVRFSIPKTSSVKVKVYDVMGQEVALLKNGTLDVGIHEINWNAEALSSGVYFLRIEATAVDQSDQFIDLKKMILMK